VERHRERAPRGAPEPRRHPLAQLVRRLAAEGQHEDLLGREPSSLDPVDDGLDQRRRLARARPGQHEQRAPGRVDHPLLVGVEHRRPRRARARTDQLVRRRRRAHDAIPAAGSDIAGTARVRQVDAS
jgi:hypothetical protein